MKKRSISFLLTIFLSTLIFAQEVSTGGILYGENWACLVTAPKGWIMDQSSFAQYGIYGLFYEETKKLGGNTPIIYINTTKLSDATDKAMNNYISYDINSYIQRGAEVQEAKLTGIKEKELKTYQIISGNNIELCSYTRYKNCCFLIILTAHTQEDIKSCIPQLKEVINNMNYMDTIVSKKE